MAKEQRWEATPHDIKSQAIAAFLQALNSPHPNVSHTSAQVIGAYGAVDIPAKRFPELLVTLCGNVGDAAAPELVKVSSLEAIGYMCEALVQRNESVTSDQTNGILTAIIGGMQPTMSDDIRKAATKALENTLEFAEKNFENENERTMIMRSIKESATTCRDADVRETAYNCLLKVGEEYYHLLQPYIQDIFTYTTNAMKTDEDDVGKAAISFWIAVCEEEARLKEDMENGDQSAKDNYLKIMENVFPHLLPVVMESTLTKQSDDLDDYLDEERWEIYDAGGERILQLAYCIGDLILEDKSLMPFVFTNFSSQDPRMQDAAITVFGKVVEHCSEERMHPLIGQALPVLLEHTQNPNIHVCSAAYFTLGQICEHHPKAVAGVQVGPIVERAMLGLGRESSFIVDVAANVVNQIALACEGEADKDTNVLSPLFTPLLMKILTVAQRTDLNNKVVQSLYWVSSTVIRNSAQDVHQAVKDILVECVNRLERTMSASADKEERYRLQESLCDVLQACVYKHEKEEVTYELADRMMHALLTLCKDPESSILSSVYYAIGEICKVMEENFARYVEHLMPFLLSALGPDHYASDDGKVVLQTIPIIEDLYRGLAVKDENDKVVVSNEPHPLQKYSDEIVGSILKLLESNDAVQTLKPLAISLFVEMSMFLLKDFSRYHESVLVVLDQAAKTQLSEDEEDPDHDEFVWEIRSSIIEVSTAIFIAYRDVDMQDMVLHWVQPIITHALKWTSEEGLTDEVLKNAVALIGDVVVTYRSNAPLIQQLRSHKAVGDLIEYCSRNENQDIREYGEWTAKALQ